MNTLSEIAKILLQKDNFIIIPHRNPDGDCLGSSVGLVNALRDMGKTAYISLPNKQSDRLSFLWDDSFATPCGFKYDVCVAVDVASDYMMSGLKEEIFDKAPLTVCVDHHGTNSGFAQYNYVDEDAAACGEIIYSLLLAMGVEFTKDIANAIYSAIVSDTGSFRYSNTTKNTFEIASKLMDFGVENSKIMKILFETKTMEQMKIMSDIISNMEFFYDGKVCITYCDNDMLKKYNLCFDDVDEYVGLSRTIQGVEAGAFLKCISNTETKASLRSNEYADVSQIAKQLGGGGHIRAAGVTINGDMQTAKQLLLDKFKELF